MKEVTTKLKHLYSEKEFVVELYNPQYDNWTDKVVRVKSSRSLELFSIENRDSSKDFSFSINGIEVGVLLSKEWTLLAYNDKRGV